MASETHYRHNHYVPVWYQKRFLVPGQDRYYRLDLHPETVIKRNSKTGQEINFTRNDLHYWSPDRIFAEDDLYTLTDGKTTNTEIEQFFFGAIDRNATTALDYFEAFSHPDANGEHFETLVRYMSIQKLRTPKGLRAFRATIRTDSKALSLIALQQLRDLHCAIWTECVWTIASAEQSPTKFIISDHPVTVYNRACPPLSESCRGVNDPDIRLHATHTFFPLSPNKIVILTNLSWVRDPYQNELRLRPNPNFFRRTVFNFMQIQTGRILSENEVLQINCITKQRAHRFIAAGEESWLYPERSLGSLNWRDFGLGYLLMPEPRLIYWGGEVMVSYDTGFVDAFNEYGHKPWQTDYRNKKRESRELASLQRFKAEWAAIHGPQHVAISGEFGRRGRIVDSDEMTDHYKKALARHGRWKLGRRDRRR